MPQLGETVSEGTISAWHVKVGDQVKIDQPLLDVETDKASTEVPSPVDGKVRQVLVSQGDTVDVGTVLAVIDDGSAHEIADEPTTEPSQSVEVDLPKDIPSASNSTQVPVEKSISKKQNEDVGMLSPAVRRLINEHDINPTSITGTGRDGRITRDDALAFIQGATNAPVNETRAINASESFSRVQKITATHMVKSKQTSAHVLQSIEVDFFAIELARDALKVDWKKEQGFSLTYLPFITKALCDTLIEFPRINANISDFESDPVLNIHQQINISIAVAIEHHELVVPVIHSADSKTVSQLAKSINELSTKARTKKLTPDLIQGGTYTISNNGSFGTLFTAPIINQPQVAILSVDRIKKQPVVLEAETGDSIVIRPMGILSQSFDHRIIDGAYSGAFLAALKSRIETTDWCSEF
jgi:2-oxoglutarate dehydrogenase E2 component (dihydrolipoamide succinyltransferase)